MKTSRKWMLTLALVAVPVVACGPDAPPMVDPAAALSKTKEQAAQSCREMRTPPAEEPATVWVVHEHKPVATVTYPCNALTTIGPVELKGYAEPGKPAPWACALSCGYTVTDPVSGPRDFTFKFNLKQVDGVAPARTIAGFTSWEVEGREQPAPSRP